MRWQKFRPTHAPFVVSRRGVREQAAGDVWLGFECGNWRFMAFVDVDGCWTVNLDGIQKREAVGPFDSLEQAREWCEGKHSVKGVSHA